MKMTSSKDHTTTTLTNITTMDSDTKMEAVHTENASSDDEFKKLSLWQAVKRWPKVSAYCLALTSAILLWGYDLAMAGNLAGLDQFKYTLLPLHRSTC